MSLPIYRIQNPSHPNAKPQHANTGLWYTRFYNAFDYDWRVGDEGKGKWISTIAGPCGDNPTLEQAAARLDQLGQALDAQVSDFKTEWHFATGLGISHPVENGFAWHHTLGVPYLASSGVKGLLRGWVEAWMDFENDDARNATINRWFGAAKGDGTGEEGAGYLIFFDALPIRAVTLSCDVMTPHMGRWYEKGGDIKSEKDYADAAPADWHSPVPVPFLVVKNATFRFVIAPRLTGNAAQDEQTRQDVLAAMQQLSLALEWLGAGAKTAAGYGRMLRTRNAAEEAAKALAEAGIVQVSGVTWSGAKVNWDKGKGTLTVNFDGKKAQLSGPEARALFDALSEAGQKRLKDGKKPLNADATVDITGNLIKLLSLKEVPAA